MGYVTYCSGMLSTISEQELLTITFDNLTRHESHYLYAFFKPPYHLYTKILFKSFNTWFFLEQKQTLFDRQELDSCCLSHYNQFELYQILK